ncbi:MAG: SAM-dependent methyltransferase [Ruminococcaceae bacterium]|nr:SAM-dependent methyltransferase [Oscillospiraceae bacterium]
MQNVYLECKMLTERLQKIKNLIEKSNTVFDVGTDHGYVPISLIKENRAAKVIAADINEGPLKNADKNIRLAGLSDYIDLRLGSGLVPMKNGEADTVIIAGMGGILIADILKESCDKTTSVEKFILQPMYSQEILRKYLIDNSFEIIKEHLVRENEKIYNIIEAVPGKEKRCYESECFLKLGHPDIIERDETFFMYIEKRKKHTEKLYENLKKAKQPKEQELLSVKQILDDLEKYYA